MASETITVWPDRSTIVVEKVGNSGNAGGAVPEGGRTPIFSAPAGAYSYEDAQYYCSHLQLAGFEDWELPTETTLLSLLQDNPEFMKGVMEFWSNTKGFTIRSHVTVWSDGSTRERIGGLHHVICVR